MAGTFYATSQGLTTKDRMKPFAMQKALYDENDWNESILDGTIDMYVSAIMNSDKINVDEFISKYELEFGDPTTRRTALYNELAADNETKKKFTFTDNNGNEYTEELTDYEMTLRSIKQHNKNYEISQMEESEKEIGAFGKHMATVWSFMGEAAKSALNAVAIDLPAMITGIVKAAPSFGTVLGNQINGQISSRGEVEAIADAYVKGVAEYRENSDKTLDYAFGTLEGTKTADGSGANPLEVLEENLIEFEKNYTYVRNDDGSLTTFGNYWVSAADSVGRMLPSMIVSMAGLPGGQAIFYGGMISQDVGEQYEYAVANGLSVTNGQILFNAGVKAGLQFGVEQGLGAIFGTSILDKLVYGKNVSKGVVSIPTKTLTGKGLAQFGLNVLQEGVEEGLQEFTDFMTNKGFEWFVNQDYAYTTENVNLQTFTDAIFLGMATSLFMSAPNIAMNKNVTVINENGKSKKLNKFASMAYSSTFEHFEKMIDDLKTMELTISTMDKNDSKYKSYVEKYQNRFENAYKSFRVVSGIYSYMGEERFTAAQNLLSDLNKDIEAGKLDGVNYADRLKKSFDDLGIQFKKELEQVAEEIKLGEALKRIQTADITETEESKKALENLEKLGVKEVITTDGGQGIVITEDGETAIIPKNKLKASENGLDIALADGENRLANAIRELFTDDIRNLSKTFFGRDVTDYELAREFLFNSELCTALLLDGNKDIYRLFSNFVVLEKKIVTGSLRDKIYKKKINDVINMWTKSLTEYCKIHNDADYTLWTEMLVPKKKVEVEREIKNERIAEKLYNKAVLGQLTDSEKAIIEKRIDNIPKSNSTKSRIKKDIFSKDELLREKGIRRLLHYYSEQYYKNYDGKIRMPDTSVANRVFNIYLNNLGMSTIADFFSEESLTDSDKTFIENRYGEINKDTVIQFRKDTFYTSTGFVLKYENENLTIYREGIPVGFNNISKFVQTSQKDDLSKMIPTNVSKRNSKIKKLLSETVNESVANTLTVGEIISNPELLSEKIQNDICKFAKDVYGKDMFIPDVEMTYLYLKRHFIKTENKTILVTNNGEYVFADLKQVFDLFKVENITENTTLQEIFGDIVPDGLTLQFVESNEISGLGGFSAYQQGSTKPGAPKVTRYKKVIRINRKLLNDPLRLKATIAHEFVHALQFEYNLSQGLPGNWTSMIPNRTLKEIVSEFEKHLPNLFSESDTMQIKISKIENLIYYGSGEVSANGMESTNELMFCPIQVKDDFETITVTLPWNYIFDINYKTNLGKKTDSLQLQVEFLSTIGKFSKPFKTFFDRFRISSQPLIGNSYESRRIFTRNQLIDAENTFAESNASLIMIENGDEKYRLLEEHFTNVRPEERELGINYLWYKYGGPLSKEEFLESELPVLVKDDVSDNGRYCIGYIGKNMNDILNLTITANDRSNISKNENIKYTIVKVKDLVGYLADDNVLLKNVKLKDINTLKSQSTTIEPIINATNIVKNMMQSDEDLAFLLNTNEEKSLRGPVVNRTFQESFTSALGKIFNKDTYKLLFRFVKNYQTTGPDTKIDNLNSDELVDLRRNLLKLANIVYTNNRLNFEDFVDLDLTYIRVVNNSESSDSSVVLSGFINEQMLTDMITGLPYDLSNNTIEIGTFKPGDTISFVSTSDNSFIVKQSNVTPVRRIKVSKDSQGKVFVENSIGQRYTEDGFYDIEPITMSERKVTDDETVQLKEWIEDVTIPKGYNEFISVLDDPTIEEGVEKPNHQYKERILLGMFKSNDGRYRRAYKYIGLDEAIKSDIRRVNIGKKVSKNTPLEIFEKKATEKGVRAQMTVRLRDLILASGHTKLDAPLQDAIDNGTLTETIVKDFIYNAEEISDSTFEILKKTYFKNTPIKNFAELEEYSLRYLPYYYAIGMALARVDEKLGSDFSSRSYSPSEFDALIENIKGIDNKLYTDVLYTIERFDKIGGKNGIGIDLQDDYARYLLMNEFDGAIGSGREVANKVHALSRDIYFGKANKRKSAGRGKSLDASVGKTGRLFSEKVADTGYLMSDDDFEYESLLSTSKLLYLENNKKRVESGEITLNALIVEFNETVNGLPYDELLDFYEDLKEEATDSEVLKAIIETNVREEFTRVGFSEGAINEIIEEKTSDEVISDFLKHRYNAVQRVKSMIKTIKKNVAPKHYKWILKGNEDIFDENLNIKIESYKSNGKIDYDKLNDVYERVKKISKHSQIGSFEDYDRFKAYRSRLKDWSDAAKESAKNIRKSDENTKVKETVKYVLHGGREFSLKEGTPSIIGEILKTTIDKFASTKVQKLSGENETHMVRSMNEFIELNSDSLKALNQFDVDAIIEFYTESQPYISGVNESIQNVTQELLLVYILKAHEEEYGNYKLSDEQVSKIKKFLQERVSGFATGLRAWNSALKYWKADEVIDRAQRIKYGFDKDDPEIEKYANEMIAAAEKGDDKSSLAAKQSMYERVISLVSETLERNKAYRKQYKESKANLNSLKKELKEKYQVEFSYAKSLISELKSLTSSSAIKNDDKVKKIKNEIRIEEGKGKDADEGRLNELRSNLFIEENKPESRQISRIKELNKETEKYKDFVENIINVENNVKKLEIQVKTTNVNKKTVLDKFVAYEKTAMLSGPGTWIRNEISNPLLTASIAISDFIGNINKLERKGLTKYEYVNRKGKIKTGYHWKMKGQGRNQYQIVGTTPDARVNNFIKENLLDNGMLDIITSGGSKYEGVQLKHKTATKILEDMILDSLEQQMSLERPKIASKIQRAYENKLGKSDKKIVKAGNKFLRDAVSKGGFVRKMLSDDKYVNNRFIYYLSRMLTEDTMSGRISLEKGLNDKKVLEAMASAYTRASMDYMHQSNFLYKMESTLRESQPQLAFVYQTIFPFMGSTWNWFIDKLDYTPPMMIKSIVQLARLEKTIENAEKRIAQGKSVQDERLIEYMVRRNLGKGVFGTFCIGASLLLALLGYAKVEEDDEEYKLIVGDYQVDISDIYNGETIYLGLMLGGSLRDERKPEKILSDAFNTMLGDSALGQVINTFRYSDTIGDYMVNAPMQFLNMMVPNFLKTLSKMTKKYEVETENAIMKWLSNSLPFADRMGQLSYTQTDIYTGDEQLRYNTPLLLNAFNALMPVNITSVKMSDNEYEAVKQGVKHGELTGKYTVDGKEISLTKEEKQRLNRFYGELNNNSLKKLYSGSKEVQQEDGTYKEMSYSAMSQKQKKAAIESTLSTNSRYSKIYILTSTGKYRYYASKSEYEELRKLGITKNIYKQTGNKKGFVKI